MLRECLRIPQKEKRPLESQEESWLDDGEKRFEENGCQRLEKSI
jgi:hypothetical protein